MSLICGFRLFPVLLRFHRQLAIPAMLVLFSVGSSAADPGSSAAEPSNDLPCRARLSKKGAMIFDDVQKKRTPDTNLEVLWKEVTRDLITANRLGREEATAPAIEALNCLRAPE